MPYRLPVVPNGNYGTACAVSYYLIFDTSLRKTLIKFSNESQQSHHYLLYYYWSWNLCIVKRLTRSITITIPSYYK